MRPRSKSRRSCPNSTRRPLPVPGAEPPKPDLALKQAVKPKSPVAKIRKNPHFPAEVMVRGGPNRLSDHCDGWPRRPLSATRRVIHGSASQEIGTDSYNETSCRQFGGEPRDVEEADGSRARRPGQSGDQASQEGRPHPH